MKKPKPPRPPRCLCSGRVRYLLGIVSPSLYYQNFNDPRAKKYRREVFDYRVAIRAVTKEEWKAYDHAKRAATYGHMMEKARIDRAIADAVRSAIWSPTVGGIPNYTRETLGLKPIGRE